MTLRRFEKQSKTKSDALIVATNIASPGVECEQCGEWCNPQSLRAPLGNQAGPDPYCIISKSFYFLVFLKFDFVCSELAAFSWNSVVSSPTEVAVLLGKALALAFLAFKGR